MVLFDASRYFQAPSPDAAFAINTPEEFLADSAQQDCTFLLTPGLFGGTRLSAIALRTNSCLFWADSVTALWIGSSLVSGKEGR